MVTAQKVTFRPPCSGGKWLRRWFLRVMKLSSLKDICFNYASHKYKHLNSMTSLFAQLMKRSNFFTKISIFATSGTVVHLFLQKNVLKLPFLNQIEWTKCLFPCFQGWGFQTAAKILMDIKVNMLCFIFVHHQHLNFRDIPNLHD